MGLEEGQEAHWPSSRNPHRCLKGAKRTKTANVFVTVVTDVTTMTHTLRTILARGLELARLDGGVVLSAKGRGRVEGGQASLWPGAGLGAVAGIVSKQPEDAVRDEGLVFH